MPWVTPIKRLEARVHQLEQIVLALGQEASGGPGLTGQALLAYSKLQAEHQKYDDQQTKSAKDSKDSKDS